jgi:hypothetical protein
MKNQKGFSVLYIILIIVVLGAIAFVGWRVFLGNITPVKAKNDNQLLLVLKKYNPSITKVTDTKLSVLKDSCSEVFLPCWETRYGLRYEGVYRVDNLNFGFGYILEENDNFYSTKRVISLQLNDFLNVEYDEWPSVNPKEFKTLAEFKNYFSEKSWKSFSSFYEKSGYKKVMLIERLFGQTVLSKYNADSISNTAYVGNSEKYARGFDSDDLKIHNTKNLKINNLDYNNILVINTKKVDCSLNSTDQECQRIIIAYDEVSNKWSMLSEDYPSFASYLESQLSFGKQVENMDWKNSPLFITKLD